MIEQFLRFTLCDVKSMGNETAYPNSFSQPICSTYQMSGFVGLQERMCGQTGPTSRLPSSHTGPLDWLVVAMICDFVLFLKSPCHLSSTKSNDWPSQLLIPFILHYWLDDVSVQKWTTITSQSFYNKPSASRLFEIVQKTFVALIFANRCSIDVILVSDFMFGFFSVGIGNNFQIQTDGRKMNLKRHLNVVNMADFACHTPQKSPELIG